MYLTNRKIKTIQFYLNNEDMIAHVIGKKN